MRRQYNLCILQNGRSILVSNLPDTGANKCINNGGIREMNVYFAGSIRGGRLDADLYNRIIHYIKKTDNVLTEHVGDLNFQENITDKEIFARDIAWLREADIVIAECSSPSHGVGYEIAYAERYNKPIHILYNKDSSLSAMLNGNSNLFIHPYMEESDIYHALNKILG